MGSSGDPGANMMNSAAEEGTIGADVCAPDLPARDEMNMDLGLWYKRETNMPDPGSGWEIPLSQELDTGAADKADKEAVDTEAADTEAMDSEAVDTVAADTEAVDTEAADTEAVDTGAVDSEAVDTVAADTEVVDTEAADTEAADTEAVDTEAVDTVAADTGVVDTETVDTGAMDTGALDAEAADTEAADTRADTEAADIAAADRKADTCPSGWQRERGNMITPDTLFLTNPMKTELACAENVSSDSRDHNCLDLQEPKMCNEKTATYWTGGGDDSQNEDNASPSMGLMDGQMDKDGTLPCNLVKDPRPLTNVRVYLPLQKTLRNLRLLDLRLKYNSQQVGVANQLNEFTEESSSSSDESDSKAPEQEEEEEEGREEENDRSSLIELLTLCQFQLEQFEELKQQSQQQSQMLWEAQETMEFLQESVASLHRENAQKEEELFFLWEELVQCKRLLREKMEQITDMKEMFRNFGEHLEKKGKEKEFDSIPHFNESLGNTAEKPTTDDPNSKICVIL